VRFRFPRPLHGWRALVGEIGVIVVGVLIALTAEQLVQQWHDRGDLHEAQQQMLLEMRDDNLPQAYARVAMAPCLDYQLTAITRAADANVSRAELNRLISEFEPPVRTWDSQAYDAAVSTGALTPNGPQELMRWATIYRVLPIMRAAGSLEDSLIGDLVVVQDPAMPLSVEERSEIVRTVHRLERANRDMSTVGQLVLNLSKSAGVEMRDAQKAEVLAELRGAYGACVRDPAAVHEFQENNQLSLVEQQRRLSRLAAQRLEKPGMR
jgi:hypothetical protein